ncbi:SH3 domain-containing protein [Sodiomyces alkalinus F11]|uniref:SH3 domain-containing protein n=1 Tax=Sodiomyces alkalinus (strain CBS 110278 / VKM F-3762 / F11) TaxID=1314773 RepID=A0A3N2Q1X8_SODAK|nr:SH3 domain-containing protein [Sodiomyces alkalinus F11]ROT40625.1 SH3 domain-containing protein [Sodiomyces alkalinus F11]
MRGVLLSALSVPAIVSAQSHCISLEGSTACPAFQSAAISTGDFLPDLFPFLRFVSNRESFDRELLSYIQTTYVRNKFELSFGCGRIDLRSTDEYYARFATTVLCNAIIQNSIDACNLSEEASRAVCADTCAYFAQSEALVTADDELCDTPGDDLVDLIRADFTNCALPAGSLTSDRCIQGIANEPENCGYGNSTLGLCSYCGSGGINSTDTCCYNSDAENRCADVTLPAIIPSMTFEPPTPRPTATDGDDDDDDGGVSGLSGGQIAGIVIGSIAGAAILAAAVFLCFLCWRRRKNEGSQSGSVFNQPAPARQPAAMEQTSRSSAPQNFEVVPGGRVARMSALEGSSEPPSRHNTGLAAGIGATAGYMTGRRQGESHSSSDFGSSPDSGSRTGVGVLRPPPNNIRKRHGSLSSGSVLAGEDPQSPTSAGGMSSPQGMASQQSEQLPFFRDYYSSDDIHPGDRVSVLWAYQPRAPDEFALERGDMLKIVGIWDDGWATGVMLDERADEWDVRRQAQRDSGVSNASGRRDTSPPISGEIKAFPLVCICRPEHWRKTIEGDGSTENGSNIQPGP